MNNQDDVASAVQAEPDVRRDDDNVAVAAADAYARISQKSSVIARYFTSHPPGFWFIFWGEFAERASFYGMKAILALYLVDQLGFSKSDTGTIMSLFIAGCYFLPLVGGWIADNYLGKFWTIVGFSLPYVIGQVMIGVHHGPFPYIAMILLAMGSGVIKPNISTLMGMTYDQQRPGQELLRSDAFAIFYLAINLGSAMSTLIMPVLRTNYGYFIAFLFPACLMSVAFVIFALGKRHYAVEVIQRTTKSPEERRQQWGLLGRLFGLFLMVTFFWAIFDQHASTWIFFARETLDLNLFGHRVEPDQIQACNPIFIIVFLPVVQLCWRLLASCGIRLRPTDKMMVGFVLTAGSMAVHALAAYMVDQSGHKVSLWWQVLAYISLTFAEILISVTGLELAFTAAPKSMKGFVTGCWLVTVGFANLFINAAVTRLYPSDSPGWHFATPTGYFSALTIMMVVVMLGFFFVARQFNRATASVAVDDGSALALNAKPEPSDAIQTGGPDATRTQKRS
jgi:POT family proton-dependent oligopeptide transporter